VQSGTGLDSLATDAPPEGMPCSGLHPVSSSVIPMADTLITHARGPMPGAAPRYNAALAPDATKPLSGLLDKVSDSPLVLPPRCAGRARLLKQSGVKTSPEICPSRNKAVVCDAGGAGGRPLQPKVEGDSVVTPTLVFPRPQDQTFPPDLQPFVSKRMKAPRPNSRHLTFAIYRSRMWASRSSSGRDTVSAS